METSKTVGLYNDIVRRDRLGRRATSWFADVIRLSFRNARHQGAEADFVRQLLVSCGVAVTLVDVGALGEAAVDG